MGELGRLGLSGIFAKSEHTGKHRIGVTVAADELRTGFFQVWF